MFFNRNTQHTLQRLCMCFFISKSNGGKRKWLQGDKGEESETETMKTLKGNEEQRAGRKGREEKAATQVRWKVREESHLFSLYVDRCVCFCCYCAKCYGFQSIFQQILLQLSVQKKERVGRPVALTVTLWLSVIQVSVFGGKESNLEEKRKQREQAFGHSLF